MCERLDVGENEDAEAVRRKFDNELGTRRWLRTENETGKYADAPVDDNAPWWWEGDAEASDSFLAAQGVVL